MPGIPPNLHADIDIDIGRQVLAEMYDTDESADLAIMVEGDRYSVALKSSVQSIIFPSDDLLESVGRLVSLHAEYSSNLRTANYHYQKEPAGSWIMSASYGYDRSE